MLKIGLTGGIGSGKSTVAAIFAQLGVPVLQADLLAKTIMQQDEHVKAQIIKAFGTEAYQNRLPNNAFIANLVFKDPELLAVLNAIVHPATILASNEWAAKQSAPYIIKEAALFFESGSAQGLDGIIGVSAPEHLRLYRVMKRDGLSREAVLNRINQQIDDNLKMKLCDWVIMNDEQQLIIPQIIRLHNQFTKNLV